MGQGVFFSGEDKTVKVESAGKPIARSLRGAKYENALVTGTRTRNRAI